MYQNQSVHHSQVWDCTVMCFTSETGKSVLSVSTEEESDREHAIKQDLGNLLTLYCCGVRF